MKQCPVTKCGCIGGNRRLYENVQQQIQEQCLKKQSGCTWIEMNNEIRTFVVDQ
jgi:hypothetical protein